jgi:glucose/arabinose dehydrogenase
VWVPSIGISGLMIYTGDKFPQWRGSFFVGGMVGERVVRLTHDPKRGFTSTELLAQDLGRIRDIRQDRDGFIYLVTEDDDGKPTPVLRVEPMERQTR